MSPGTIDKMRSYYTFGETMWAWYARLVAVNYGAAWT